MTPTSSIAAADSRHCHPVSRGELERRWALCRKLLAAHELDALVVQGANGISGGGYFRWLAGQASGNYNPRTLVFWAEGPMTLIDQGPLDAIAELDPDDAEMPGFGRRCSVPSYPSVAYTATYDVDIVLAQLAQRAPRRVGIVGVAALPARFFGALQGRFGDRLVDITDEVDRLKAVKSAEEIGQIRAAAAMQDEVVRQTVQHIRPGLKEFEVMAWAQYVGQLQGSELGMFFGSSAPAGRPTLLRPRSQQGRTLQAGDAFMLLVENAGPGGMFAHIARPIVLGRASTEMQEAFDAVLEAQRFTLDRLRPGVEASALFADYSGFLAARGLPAEKRLYAHGQGYDLVERPLVRQDETMAFATHMNIAVHPSVATGRVFMTVCENYLLTDDGTECLHRTPQRIIELA